MQLPSPAELLKNAGPIGICLRSLPAWIPAEAETKEHPWDWLAKKVSRGRVEHRIQGLAHDFKSEVARYEKAGFKRTAVGVWEASKAARTKTGIRNIRFQRHCRDANKRIKRIIMDAHWPASFRKIFLAAASQREAIRRLGETAADGGSIFKSHHAELQAALKKGRHKVATHWARKVAASILRTKDGRHWLMQDKCTPAAIREHARLLYKQLYARDVRRFGRRKADARWRSTGRGLDFARETTSDKIAVQLSMGWLSLPAGFPGYCFLSHEVTAMVLGLFLLPGLLNEGPTGYTGRDFILQVCKRIGLKKGEVIVTQLKKLPNGDWAGYDSDGHCWGILRLQSNALPPKLSHPPKSVS